MTPAIPVTREMLHRRKDGTTFAVEARAGLLAANGRRLILTLARDVTERKQAERALREAQD